MTIANYLNQFIKDANALYENQKQIIKDDLDAGIVTSIGSRAASMQFYTAQKALADSAQKLLDKGYSAEKVIAHLKHRASNYVIEIVAFTSELNPRFTVEEMAKMKAYAVFYTHLDLFGIDADKNALKKNEDA